MSNTAGELGRCDSLRKTWQVVSFWGLPAVVATIAIVLSIDAPRCSWQRAPRWP